MRFIYKGKKCFGLKEEFLINIIEDYNVELNSLEIDTLVDMMTNDEFPDQYYDDGLFNFDKLINDVDVMDDIAHRC